VRLYACDVSDEALACTRANVDRHGLKDRVAVRRSDLLAGIPADRPLDWVIANPPYIPAADIAGLAPEVRLEPRLALDGGPDGLDVYRRLLPEAARRARRGVIVEVGEGQASAVRALMEAEGLAVDVTKDLAGMERVVAGRRGATDG
jgi:release factor glutamine methyltransferase